MKRETKIKKKIKSTSSNLAIQRKRPKKLYLWLLWGFTFWFILVSFLFRGIGDRTLDILSTTIVPDWIVPYDKTLEKKVLEMTKGHPIEKMSRYIGRFDEKTAAFLVGIAKKESNWGKRVPLFEGKDCYNYWGFRDRSNTLGSSGYSCFSSPEEAVRAVGKRIHELVYVYQKETPQDMVVWKCGSLCDKNDESTAKWIRDIDHYYSKFIEKEK
ncbi:MAG: glucosaminidase domain-containing protein [Candidatus Moraniibacteriota bacterium]|nr:MAG: glucosaminidase domain-containing protein [Candidatus Moranbacteria bacterium]